MTARAWLSAVVLLFVLSLLLPLTSQAQPEWEYAGPQTGRLDHWWSSPFDPNLVLVRGDLVGHPLGEASTLISHDGGQSFSEHPTIGEATFVAWDQVGDDPRTWAFSQDHVWCSDDGGQSWELAGNGPGYEIQWVVAYSEDVQGVHFLAVTERDFYGRYRRIQSTSEASFSWQTVYESTPGNGYDQFTSLSVDPTETNHLFSIRPRGNGSNAIHESSDGGASWERIESSVIPGGLWRDPVCYWPSQGNVMVADLVEGGLTTSNLTMTNWETWEELPGAGVQVMNDQSIRIATSIGISWRHDMDDTWHPFPQTFSYPPANYSGVTPGDVRLSRHVDTPVMAVAATERDVWARHGGVDDAYWTLGIDGFRSAKIEQLGVCSQGVWGMPVARGERGIYTGSPLGQAWTLSLEGQFQGMAVHPLNVDRLLAWGPGGVWFTENGGASWQQPALPVSMTSASFTHFLGGYVYFNGEVDDMGLGLYRADGEFTTFERATEDAGDLAKVMVDPYLWTDIYAYTVTEIHRSTDAGLTYVLINDDELILDLVLDVNNTSNAWIRTTQWDHALVSHDRGETFPFELEYPDDIELLASGWDFLLAAKWQEAWINVDYTDQGWVEVTENLPEEIYISGMVTDSNQRIYLSTERAGIYRMDYYMLGVEQPEGAVARRFELLPAYPNPFNGTATVTVSVDRPGALTVDVINLLGQQVAVLGSGRKVTVNPGSHPFVWDAHGMASGVYLVRATMPGQADLQRVTLVK